MSREPCEIGGHRRRNQGHPAHHTRDEGVVRGESEQPARFLHALAGLHAHHRVDTRDRYILLQIRRQKVPPDGRHVLVYPTVLSRSVAPEVMMRVDDHLFSLR